MSYKKPAMPMDQNRQIIGWRVELEGWIIGRQSVEFSDSGQRTDWFEVRCNLEQS